MSADRLEEEISAGLTRFTGRANLFLAPPEGREVVPAVELLAPENIDRFAYRGFAAYARWSDDPHHEDIRFVMSRFAIRYVGTVVQAALGSLAQGVALDLSLSRVSLVLMSEEVGGVVLDLAGAPAFTCAERPTSWPIGAIELRTHAELRERALASLFADNLLPAMRRMLDRAHLSHRMLWTTAAEMIELFYRGAHGRLDAQAFAPLADDRQALLFADVLPGVPGPNPILGLLKWETYDDPLIPEPSHVRQVCCTIFAAAGRPSYCRTCVLITKEQRHEQWRRIILNPGLRRPEG